MEKRHKTTWNMAVGGIYLALSVICMVGGVMIPVLDLTFLAVASAVIAFGVIEIGVRNGVLIYVGAGLLGFWLIPNKAVVLLYVAYFGCYPLVKYAAEKHAHALVQLTIKGFFSFALLCVAFFAFFNVVFGDLAIPSWCPRWVVIPASMLIMGIFDYALTVVILFYQRRIHPRIISIGKH